MNEQYIDTIHRYLAGKMDITERTTFETDMKNDPTLRNDVELERALLAGLEKSGEEKVRKTIKKVHQDLSQQGFFETPVRDINFRTSNTTIMKRILAVAAVLIVLLGGIWFFRNQDTGPDTQAIFAQHFDKQDDQTRVRETIASLESYGFAGVQTDADTLKTALEQYEAGNYKEAQTLLEAFLKVHPENDTAQYYLGVTHMSQEHYIKAIELFLPISRSDDSELKNDALWNLGLCYLMTVNGDQDAREVFEELADDSAYTRHREAQAVLDQLIDKD